MTESQILDGVNGSAQSSKASSPVPIAPNAPRFGTIIPNRIFVGGVAFNTSDAELKNFFSAYGHVKETKIIADRAGVSKGYGFVTFETQDEADRILKEQPNSLIFKDKKLNIGKAIRKQPSSYPKTPVDPALIPNGMVLHSPSGYPYTYHNGMAYFHTNEGALPANPGGPPGALTTHHAHAPHHQQPPTYAPYTIPAAFMVPSAAAASHHQYITAAAAAQQQQQQQQQPQQYTTYAPPVSVSTAAPQQWTPPQPQWRCMVHPSQLTKQISAGSINGGLISPYYTTAPANATAATPDGMVFATNAIYQSPEVAEAVPMMEPAQAEGTVIATTSADPVQVATPQAYYQQQPQPQPPQMLQQQLQQQLQQAPPPLQLNPPPPGIMHATRPYLTAADLAYTDPAAYQALMQPRAAAPQQNKYAAKRPIRMPRRDRAPKAFRTAMDGMNYAIPRPDDVSSGEN